MNAENKDQKAILQTEKAILKQEKVILDEIKKEEGMIKRLQKNVWFSTILMSILIVGGALGFLYWRVSMSRIFTDKAIISAPMINLAPQNSGILQEVFVNEGDQIGVNTVVARVGDELIKSKSAGIISTVQINTGKLYNRGEAVIDMYDPNELHVVGSIEEDQGLSQISIGQRTIFTVDAFGSKEYEGVVDEISPTSRQGDIVFNISDKRPTQEFDIKVRFDIEKYPELKNGMSARLWIYQ